MPARSRAVLKSQFKRGSIPSQQSFETLIDSMLNKSEDQFLGRWRPGVGYRKGDVVIYDRALWEMKGEETICRSDPPEEGDTWQQLHDGRIDELEAKVAALEATITTLTERIEKLENPS